MHPHCPPCSGIGELPGWNQFDGGLIEIDSDDKMLEESRADLTVKSFPWIGKAGILTCDHGCLLMKYHILESDSDTRGSIRFDIANGRFSSDLEPDRIDLRAAEEKQIVPQRTIVEQHIACVAVNGSLETEFIPVEFEGDKVKIWFEILLKTR